MLKTFAISFNFKRSVKSGFYIDYLFKKLSLYLLKNQFNWTSIFILEKFFIEYISRYSYNLYTLTSANFNKFTSINYSIIVYFIIIFFLY